MITVKMARIMSGRTQIEIAEILGVETETYMRLEDHPEDMTVDDARKFAEAVQMDIADIIFFGAESN